MVSKSKNIIHKTWGPPISGALYKRLYFRGYYPCGHPRDTFCLHIVSVASATPRSAFDVQHVLHVGSSDGYKTLSYLGHHHFGRISVSVDLWPALFTVTQ